MQSSHYVDRFIDRDAEEMHMASLVASHISPRFRHLIDFSPHPNGGARVLTAHWRQIVDCCPTINEQHVFAKEFIALGLAERLIPIENGSLKPLTRTSNSAAYFCMAVVRKKKSVRV